MTVRFFAQARELGGCDTWEFCPPSPLTPAELWDRLEEEFPAIGRIRDSARFARNFEYATGDTLFQDSDEVAVIPPVSGG